MAHRFTVEPARYPGHVLARGLTGRPGQYLYLPRFAECPDVILRVRALGDYYGAPGLIVTGDALEGRRRGAAILWAVGPAALKDAARAAARAETLAPWVRQRLSWSADLAAAAGRGPRKLRGLITAVQIAADVAKYVLGHPAVVRPLRLAAIAANLAGAKIPARVEGVFLY